MLDFQPLTYEKLPALKPFFERCSYNISEYTLISKIMWKSYFNADFAVFGDCLIYKNNIFGKAVFSYPICDETMEDEALKQIETYCVENYIPLIYNNIPQEKVSKLAERYRFMRLSEDRNYEEYLYDGNAFRAFSGRKYAGQRNHINKFNALYPNAVFKRFTSADKPRLDVFFKEFLRQGADEEKTRETRFAKKLVRSLPLEEYLTGGYEIDGKIVSFTLGSRMGKTLFIHIEKGLRDYEGVYTATAYAFAKANGDAEFINREDDSGAKGLRISKTQYHPLRTVRKFWVIVDNEWQKIRRFPSIRTERLTVDAIHKTDAKDYFDLCTDDDRNVYWGYDYKNDLEGELYPDYFYDVQKRDLKNKICFCFAVRLDGKMIGEGVLYRFTCTGQAEAGIRIARAYAGNGYGEEAFAALTEWALYGLGLDVVVSKCYHENAASYRMLSRVMRSTGSDETFYWFERRV